MGRRLERIALVGALLVATGTTAAERTAMPFDLGGKGGRKEPITITSDALEFSYKDNVIVYRGNVVAVQGDVKLASDTLTINLERAKDDGKGEPKKEPEPASPEAAGGKMRLQSITAVGKVRIDQGQRWATGGRAVFDQTKRTVVLTETPVLHDGPNEVAGERVVVYLDENRSVVEGGEKRVKAVFFPDKGGGLAPDGDAKPKTDTVERPR